MCFSKKKNMPGSVDITQVLNSQVKNLVLSYRQWNILEGLGACVWQWCVNKQKNGKAGDCWTLQNCSPFHLEDNICQARIWRGRATKNRENNTEVCENIRDLLLLGNHIRSLRGTLLPFQVTSWKYYWSKEWPVFKEMLHH